MRDNRHYCFVDFETREEASAAIKALHGKAITGGRLKVALAGDIPDRLIDRHTDVRYGRRAYLEDSWRPKNSQAGSTAGSNAAMTSSD